MVSSALRVAIAVGGLTGVIALIASLISGPLYWFDAHHVVWLFGTSNLAFLFSSLLLIGRLVNKPSGAAGISLHAQRLNLVAATLRAVFTLSGGAFSNSWLSRLEAILSVVGMVALVLILEPVVVKNLFPSLGQGAVASETFPSGKVLLGIISASLIGSLMQRQEDSARWLVLTTAIYIQAVAMLPQRELLLRTKRLPAVTSFAFFLLALGGLLRLLMWIALVCEAEVHLFIMLGDFLQVGLLADFVVLYTRTLADRGIGGLLDGAEVDLWMEQAV